MVRVAGHPSGRFLGYVQVQVASRTYALRVEALPSGAEGSGAETGFFAEGVDRFGILVDGEASAAIVERTIERASADAARHISRTLLN
ncbi:MAG: hypothetical protein ACLP1X_09720 [Polyangiaceae bacterium]|jgi:hypothetical protein